MSTLAILAHDDTASVVSVNGQGEDGRVWVTFGKVTPTGFSPCYASIQVQAHELHTVAQ